MKAIEIHFDKEYIYIETDDNQSAKLKLNWFPRLKNATKEELMQYELWADGEWIHWEKLGEDLSTEGFFTYNKLKVDEFERI